MAMKRERSILAEATMLPVTNAGYIFVGSNLTGSWRLENKDIWQVNYRGPSVSGTLASLDTSNELREAIKTDDWNEIHIIARGNTLIQIYNGRMMSMLIDDDAAGRAMEGLIGLQLHTGEPMKIEFRKIRLKQFKQ
jgi:hypothetical protein